MEKITHIRGIAAPLLVDNISTDIISPGSVMTSPKADFAKGLFSPWRYLADGAENPDFVLNQAHYRKARVLLTGANFGCGSSREAAVWCLQRYGIACVIAPSFAEIFLENAFKNGVVPIILPQATISALAASTGYPGNDCEISVDLETLTITGPTVSFPFVLDAARRDALLNGLDEIDIILKDDAEISRFQSWLQISQPWLFRTADDIRAEAIGASSVQSARTRA